MIRGVTDMFDVVCDVCTVTRCVAGGLSMCVVEAV